MTETRNIRSLGIEQPGRMCVHEYQEGPLSDGQFRVSTLYSGFSAGTELTFLKGSNPYLTSRWDDDYGVFVPGEPSAHYPLPFLGYMETGRITESRSSAMRAGDIVGMTYGHKTGHTADPRCDFAVVLPRELEPILGIYVAQMGPICANGLLHAAADLGGTDVRSLADGVMGRNVVVIGAGAVGLLTAAFARHQGAAEVLIVDPTPFRRKIAEAMGFVALEESIAWRFCKDRWTHGASDRGADVVLQCRAKAASLQEALRALRPQGTVIDLAFYQGGAETLRLGEEFHHNGLAIRCAQISRVPRGLGFAWNRQRLARETVNLLLAQGELIRKHMITDIVPFEDAPAFISDLVQCRRDFLQIVFEVEP